MNQSVYPRAPEGVTDGIIAPSRAFRKAIKKVILALVGFGILYLLLVSIAIGLAAVLAAVAWNLVIHAPHWITIALGIGLLIMGVMIVAFVFKFLFAERKSDETGYTEIFEKDYPDLFAFVRRISEETGTPFPKRMYLSPDVNAAVFYDATFWSMFFPVRKNLVIGLGLVNMLNLSELKAVIAHEFGHFSQKSMRAGSYVYHANKVLYNLLFDNKGYSEALQGWASVHFIFGICGQVTAWIVRGMQGVLQLAYRVVNHQYMGLSRQMEFHADAVAAKISGANNAIHALRRIEFANACYTNVLEKYNEWIPENLRAVNLYSQHRIAASFIAAEFELPLQDGLPLISDSSLQFAAWSRIRVEDQWASHPSRPDREQAMMALGYEAPVIAASAWTIFPEPSSLQESVSAEIYKPVQFSGEVIPLLDDRFEELFGEGRRKNRFPALFGRYYDNRSISKFDPEEQCTDYGPVPPEPALFFQEQSMLQHRRDAAEVDITLLEKVADKKNGLRSFDFEGTRFSRKHCNTIRLTIEQDLAALDEQLRRLDHAVYCSAIAAAGAATPLGRRLTNAYREYYALKDSLDTNIASCNSIIRSLQSFYTPHTNERFIEMGWELEEQCNAFCARLDEHDAFVEGLEIAQGAATTDDYRLGRADIRLHNANVTDTRLQQIIRYLNAVAAQCFKSLFDGQHALLVLQETCLRSGRQEG